MIKQMPLDELNTFKSDLTQNPQAEREEEDIIDEILDLAILSYLNGVNDANDMLGTNETADVDKMREAIYREYDGRDFAADVKRHFALNSASGIALVADTTSHRAYVMGELDAARSGGVAQTKTWGTMLDDKVRDTHEYLQSETIPIDADFYTYTGAKAQAPGLFGIPEEDCNCRCWLTFN